MRSTTTFVRRFPGFALDYGGGKRVEHKAQPSKICQQFMNKNFDEASTCGWLPPPPLPWQPHGRRRFANVILSKETWFVRVMILKLRVFLADDAFNLCSELHVVDLILACLDLGEFSHSK